MDVLYTKIYELLETEKMFLCDKEAKEMDLKICENETKLIKKKATKGKTNLMIFGFLICSAILQRLFQLKNKITQT